MLYTQQPPHLTFHHQAAICLVECQSKWLLLQNVSGEDHGDLWGSPGGKVEPGETGPQAILREVREETGLGLSQQEVQFVSKVYVVPLDWQPYILHVFQTSLKTRPKSIRLDKQEHQQYGWFTPEEVLQLPLVPGSRMLVKLLMNKS